jgi:hypothetical protein
MQPPPFLRRCQPLHEYERRHHQVRGAIAPRRLELQLHLAGGVELNPFVRQRRSGDVAAQLLQPLAVVRINTQGRVQAVADVLFCWSARACVARAEVAW